MERPRYGLCGIVMSDPADPCWRHLSICVLDLVCALSVCFLLIVLGTKYNAAGRPAGVYPGTMAGAACVRQIRVWGDFIILNVSSETAF